MYVLKEYVVQQKVDIFLESYFFCMHLKNKKKTV